MKVYSANTDAPTGQIVDVGCQKFLGRYLLLESAKAACQALEDKAATAAGANIAPLEWKTAKYSFDAFLHAYSHYEHTFQIHEFDVDEG